MNENDLPKKLVNVESIDEVDCSPFYLQRMVHSDRVFVFAPPLVLTPELDETNQLYCLTHPELGIDVYAYTRDQLDLGLKEQVAFLWDTYALSPDEELTESALTFKKNLLAAVREVVHASRKAADRSEPDRQRI